ncbi:mechanosensitive ion channel [Galbibacter sp. EGI 63066]|uniref:mechanosensitive ion channel family protein n=1 Tax=Galbibacter sp. EGI 63066 TaxID=2993559 RepID=UPI00224923F2|nr:mechanosensitive ion channel domain-containing protein [Galbibacter sp. EGI 63066]MCX2681783.1 mechanosensitive ion channel [Galbibacter sp. EGI 63066]
METEKWIEKGFELILDYAPKVLLAILIWIVGSWIFGRLVKYAKKIMVKREYDVSLQGFLSALLYWGLKVLLIVIILGTLGIETTSFAAIIASAGLAIGFALQGSLSNFAGGVLILIFKPFKVGDFIEAQGVSGTVKEIGIINTTMNTFGNQLAILPNGKLSNENIVNYSAESIRRENIISGISYDSDIKKAKSILLDIVTSNEKVLKHPAPQVMVAELADSSINLSLRYWATNENFWDCRWYVLEEIKYRFDAEGIEIPFPHQVEIQKQG